MWRSEAYRDFIRAKPCAKCGEGPLSEAHHHRWTGIETGIAMKPSDVFLVPLCRQCHIGVHWDRRLLMEDAVETLKMEQHDRGIILACLKNLSEFLERSEK